MSDLAVVIIASERRRTTTFLRCLESALAAEPAELVVVAPFPVEAKDVRSYVVPDITRTTIDALVKRDVGTCATTSPNICYLCDDHALSPDFGKVFEEVYAEQNWSAIVPARYCYQPGAEEKTWLSVGQDRGYIGGHCGIFRRYWVTRELPWAAGPHNRNWDFFHSQELKKRGARIAYAFQDLAVCDLEPDARPWDTFNLPAELL